MDDRLAEIRARWHIVEVEQTYPESAGTVWADTAQNDVAWLLTEVERLTRDLKDARSRLAKSYGAERTAEKRATQSVEDMMAMREQWRIVIAEKRGLIADLSAWRACAETLADALYDDGHTHDEVDALAVYDTLRAEERT